MNNHVDQNIVAKIQAINLSNERKALDDYFEKKEKDILQVKFDAKGNVIRDLRKEYELYNEDDTIRVLPNVNPDFFKAHKNYVQYCSTANVTPKIDKVPLAEIPKRAFQSPIKNFASRLMSLLA